MLNFDEFPAHDKAAWLAQLTRDLKDKPLDSLDWKLSDDLVVTPLVHADDFQESPKPLSQQPNSWEICEDIAVDDPGNANQQSMEALYGGAGSLEFQLSKPADTATLRGALSGIYLDFIGLHFSGVGVQQNPAAVLAALQNIAKENGLSTTALRGTLAFSTASTGTLPPDWRYMGDLIEFAEQQFPQFHVLNFRSSDQFSEKHEAADELADLLRQVTVVFQQLTQRQISASAVVKQIHFTVQIGSSYFLEMAKLRALQQLWQRWLEKHGQPALKPVISVRFNPNAYTDDVYTNMVRAASMSMSAVLGGATRLTVMPYDSGREDMSKYPASFGRRVARNVQHLMKMESGLDQYADPAAGSYYIETLTKHLVEQAEVKI